MGTLHAWNLGFLFFLIGNIFLGKLIRKFIWTLLGKLFVGELDSTLGNLSWGTCFETCWWRALSSRPSPLSLKNGMFSCRTGNMSMGWTYIFALFLPSHVTLLHLSKNGMFCREFTMHCVDSWGMDIWDIPLCTIMFFSAPGGVWFIILRVFWEPLFVIPSGTLFPRRPFYPYWRFLASWRFLTRPKSEGLCI